jgi:hypothetical protein
MRAMWGNSHTRSYHAAGHVVDTTRKVILNTPYAGISHACYKVRCESVRMNNEAKSLEDV